MNFSSSSRLLFASALSLALAAGCGSTSDLVDDGKAVSSIEISPNKDTMSVGATIQLTATLRYADGSSRDVSADASTVWNTNDASVATVSAGGRVTAVKAGVVDVSADYKGEKANDNFAVTP